MPRHTEQPTGVVVAYKASAEGQFVAARNAAEQMIEAARVGDLDRCAQIAFGLDPNQRTAVAMLLAAEVADLRDAGS